MSKLELSWDWGTGYDFFISLNALHKPERYGLRGSWAAGVRSRLPAGQRDLLQEFAENALWPLRWVYHLPPPKDAETVLHALEQRDPQVWFAELMLDPGHPAEWRSIFEHVTENGEWTKGQARAMEADVAEELPHKTAKDVKKYVRRVLTLWSSAQTFYEGLLPALRTYQDEFFAEEEVRIRPALKAAYERGQELAREMDVDTLLETLSQGVRVEEKPAEGRLILVPSFWATPLMLFIGVDDQTELRVFGARPADMSLVPGEVVPDALHQALKALADPTRLRILRYLSSASMTPAELARRLRLRPPTVIHHLDTLRLARLVQVTLTMDGKRYAIRTEAIDETHDALRRFLELDAAE